MITLTVLDGNLDYYKGIIKSYFNGGSGIGIDLTQCSKETKKEIQSFIETLSVDGKRKALTQ